MQTVQSRSRAAAGRSLDVAAVRSGLVALALLLAPAGVGGPGSEASAQSAGGTRAGTPLPAGPGAGGNGGGGAPADDVALSDLLNAARDGSGDPHLPFVLVRLKRALGQQDVIAFLDLVDPKYFADQFGTLATPKRSPGEAMAQFTCEFISVCDIAKTYKFKDVVSMRLVSVGRLDTPLDQPVEIKIELQMWDGVMVPATIFYNRRSYRLSSSSG